VSKILPGADGETRNGRWKIMVIRVRRWPTVSTPVDASPAAGVHLCLDQFDQVDDRRGHT
jgi:hypothetical protein